MKKYLSLIVLAVIFTLSCSAQNKETRDVDGFTKISFGVAGELILKQGSNFSVVLEGSDGLLEEIQTNVKDGRLIIRKKNWRFFKNEKLTAYVTMPEVEALSVSGSGTLNAEGALNCDNLDLSVSGSGNLILEKLAADMIDCSISGSGNINVAGTGADEGELSISGSGRYVGSDFKLETIDIRISGSGSCKCWVTEKIEASVSGSGDVYYKGDPSINSRVSGSGKVRKL